MNFTIEEIKRAALQETGAEPVYTQSMWRQMVRQLLDLLPVTIWRSTLLPEDIESIRDTLRPDQAVFVVNDEFCFDGPFVVTKPGESVIDSVKRLYVRPSWWAGPLDGYSADEDVEARRKFGAAIFEATLTTDT